MIFLDNASSTKTDIKVWNIVLENSNQYGNPSSYHDIGKKSQNLISKSRETTASYINAKPNEIIFTSSGTESNNLGIIGYALANANKGNHIISTVIEHISVLNPLKYLQRLGFEITLLKVDNKGYIDIHDFKKSIRKDTILISIIHANNEIGTIQDIQSIGEIAKEKDIVFHTDSVAAIGHIDIDVNKQNIAMLSLSGHKFHSIKGIGVLYVKEKVKLQPLIYGAGQNFGLNSGTENVYGVIAMRKAIELLVNDENKQNHINILNLKKRLIEGLKRTITDIAFNGDIENGLNNIINVSFNGVSGYDVVMELNKHDICCSQGSAVKGLKENGSHVIKAISNEKRAFEAVRISLSKFNTIEEIDILINILPDIIKELRGI